MNPRIPRPRRAPILAVAVLASFCASCADDGRPKLYPATGKVLVDGKGVAGIKVRLDPVDRLRDVDALHPSGVTDDQGTYTLGSFDQGDGAPAGTYKVTLFWPDSPSSQGRPNDLFRGKYNDPQSSRFESTIAERANDLATIEVTRDASPPKPRPGARKKPANDPDGPTDGDGPTSR